MALKRQQDMMATFSMASMTDIIFLLLVFFMVTSTYVFPTALEVNLPEGVEQTPVHPTTRVYIDENEDIYVASGEEEPQLVTAEALPAFLQTLQAQPQDDAKEGETQTAVGTIALYADVTVPYGKVVEVLNMAATNNLKMVLATKAAPASIVPSSGEEKND
jgi:biopolymer transport protein ExbD